MEIYMVKKMMAFAGMLVMVCACVGCGEKVNSLDNNVGNIVANSVDNSAGSSAGVQEMSTLAVVESISTAAQKETQTFAIYKSDDEAMNLITNEVECEIENKDVQLWQALIDEGVFSKKCKLLSVKQEGECLVLNVNKAYGDELRKMGTSGERMMVGAVVNTYIDAYDCREVMIREEGETMSSGHMIYDYKLTKME